MAQPIERRPFRRRTLRRRPPEVSEYWDIFVRRRWWILIPTLLILGGTFLIVPRLPKIYRSQTLIMVEPQTVPPDYVKPTVTVDDSSRLQIITQEVLSRTGLQQIIDQLGLYREESTVNRTLRTLLHEGKRTQEDIIGEMRGDITVEPVVGEDPRRQMLAAVKISYEGRDPSLVQEVTRQLASSFIQQNLRVREQQSEGTTEFIDSQLQEASKALTEQEARLRQFRATRMGELPEQQAANLQILGQLQASLQANTESLARARDQKTYLESLLSTLTKPEQIGQTSPSIQGLLEARRGQLAIAEQSLKPDHPDIVRLREEVKALEKLSKQPAAVQTGTGSAAPADGRAQLRSQIAVLDEEIKRRNKQQTEIETRISDMQRRVEMLPAVEQQLAEITRDYQVSKANYETLLEKKNGSTMAAEMERRAKGEQFRVLDPASFPEKPYEPNVTQLMLLGVLASIVVGCALGLFMEFKDRSINNVKDAEFYLSLPALATLPVIPEGGGRKTRAAAKDRARTVRLELNSATAAAETARPTFDITALQPPPPPEDVFLIGAKDKTERRQTLPLETPPDRLVAARGRSSCDDSVYAKEQFRMVRTRLLELRRVREIRTVLVTSAVQGEGKTLVAANLAFAMSGVEGLRVLLVDADLHAASLADLLGIKPPAGLSTYLLNGKRLSDIQWHVNPSLVVVPTLRQQENSAELLNGDRMKEFVQHAMRDYDLIVIDAPPVLAVADAQVLASLVDAAILVVRAGSCPFDLARNAVELLQTKVVGTVLNGVKRFPAKSYYYSYYGRAEKS